MFKTLAFSQKMGFIRRKTVIFGHLYTKMFRKLPFIDKIAFFCVYLLIRRLAPHQITASAYLVRDDAGLR